MSSTPKNRNFSIQRSVLIASGAVLATGFGIWLLSSTSRVQEDLHQLHKTPTEAAKREFDASLEATKALVGGLGTIATIAAGVVLYLNYKNAEDKLAHEKEKAQKEAELAESRLITERFSKAVEQLGGEKMEVRIGGIYALEQIAKDSQKYENLDSYHWTVMEILTAFIRERSRIYPQTEQHQEDQIQSVITDVQAALTVIGRRNSSTEKDEQILNLSQTNLSKANLSKFNFQRAILKGSNLQKANLTEANLQEANLIKANLQRTELRKAELQKATLINAELQHTNLTQVDCQNANLHGAYLQNSILVEAKLQNAILSEANLQKVDLTDANFSEANFQHVDNCIELRNAKLCRTILPDGTICDRDCQELGISKG